MRKNINPTKDKMLQKWCEILRCQMPEIREKYGVRSFWLFGSYVKGTQKRHSDLDVLVEFDRSPNFFDYIELEDRLSDLLGVKVDLVMKKALKENIGIRIFSEMVQV